MSYWHIDYHSKYQALTFEVTEVLKSIQSPYQKIEVVETPAYGKVLLLDDDLMLTEKDEFAYHEMLVHPTMFTHSYPQKILIIGGGDCGTLTRVLQHKTVEKVVIVELDEMVTQVSQEYFPQLVSSTQDPRVELIFTDGIKYVHNCTDKFDVILVDSTDPIGPAEGLFRLSFFQDCHKILEEDGILCLQSESPWIPELAELISYVNQDLKSLFPVVKAYGAAIQTYQAGFWIFQLASKKYNPLSKEIENKIKEADLKTKYYNPNIHYGAFKLPTFVNELLHEPS
ncbi:MAG TPA: polyamine aminopropyltransferase [Candidatus Syntrophosphaera thermopropionivorans]|nr:polyamine aminopropyltransferase [Candidatus Syntrophosphaera thermopropionivorans]